ncbi:spermidine synthase [Neocloeon triangulifer]|uniref:spermidine synthase n=1 Tax=Neocloeon triangulifer TaxID=2078957 RepID=UPI00286F142C|nr:spermidine synthase [Neocloeon triangulifer]
MDSFKKGWFSEIGDMWPGMVQSIEVDSLLHETTSDFQQVQVLQTKHHGRMLVLDGVIQCTEFDEFSYQEMISFLPLCSHPRPEKVLIIGGGDGGVAREVVKHPAVREVVQCEIDAEVVNAAKKYLPTMSSGFSHPKLSLHIGDGFAFMGQHQGEFDVIITDSSDPDGPAEALFGENYFKLMKSALRAGGIVCSQGETVWTSLDLVYNMVNHCSKHFPNVSYAFTSVPTYPTGQIGFVLGSLDQDVNFTIPATVFTDEEKDKFELKYYNENVHRAAFALPTFVQKRLSSLLRKK